MDKEKVHQQTLNLVQTKLLELEAHYRDLREGQSSNTKSTAGDKHDTEREMVQAELNNYSRQIQAQKQNLNSLKSIDTARKNKVEQGALVQTANGWFYISIPLGKMEFEGEHVWLISLASPMGQALKGKKAGEMFELNGVKKEILDVF
jgi:transcription elongation GreA/GreB family factor